MEISFSSNHYQWYLNNVSNIHSHFLVDKQLFTTKSMGSKDLILNYYQAAEHENKMLYLGTLHSKQECILSNKKKLLPHKKPLI